MFNVMNCCRLCLKDDGLQKFNCKDISELCTKINQHFAVLISEDDEYSTKICQECASKVYNFSLFYNSVQHNQEQLKWFRDIQKKVNEIKQEDDECVIVEVETNDVALAPILRNNMKNENSNNLNNKRSAEDFPILSQNESKQFCPLDNIQPRSNEVIPEVSEGLISNDTDTTINISNCDDEENNIKTNQKAFEVSSSVNQNNISIIDNADSIINFDKSDTSNKSNRKNLQNIKDQIRVLCLSKNYKKLFKNHHCKHPFVKLIRHPLLEALLCNRKLNNLHKSQKKSNINDSRESVNSLLNIVSKHNMKTDNNIIKSQKSILKNDKKLIVQKIKGTVAKEVIVNNNDAEKQVENKLETEDLEYNQISNLNTLNNDSVTINNSTTIQKQSYKNKTRRKSERIPELSKSKKQNITGNEINLQLVNKLIKELKNISPNKNTVSNTKLKLKKINATEKQENFHSDLHTEEISNISNNNKNTSEIDTNSQITKSIDNTMHDTPKQLSNVQQNRAIINVDNSKSVTLPSQNNQKSTGFNKNNSENHTNSEITKSVDNTMHETPKQLSNVQQNRVMINVDNSKSFTLPSQNISSQNNQKSIIGFNKNNSEIDTNSQVTKSIDNTMHETPKQLSNGQQNSAIINIDDSKSVTLHAPNISSQNNKNLNQQLESLSIVLNPNQFETMMKQTENSKLSTENMANSTIIQNVNEVTHTTNVAKPTTEPLEKKVLQVIIKPTTANTNVTSTTITTTNTKMHNAKKAPMELYARQLYPAKLPKGQALTESFYLQNQIPSTSINISSRLGKQLPIASTSRIIPTSSPSVPPIISSQTASLPLATTIPSTVSVLKPSFRTIAKPPINLSQLTAFSKAYKEEIDRKAATVTNSTLNRMAGNTNKNIIITKNLQLNNTVQKEKQTEQNKNQQIQQQNNQHQQNIAQLFYTRSPNFELSFNNKHQQVQQNIQQQYNQPNNHHHQQAGQQNNQHELQNNQHELQNNQHELQTCLNKVQNNNTHLRVKILTVPELNQKAANNQLLYNNLISSTSIPSTSSSSSLLSTPSTSFVQIYPSPTSIYQKIHRNLSRTKIVATMPDVDNPMKARISVKILVHSENKNQLTIKLNNLATGKLCHYWDLTEAQKEAVKQSLSAIDKKSVEKFKPYQLDDYGKNLLDRINFIEFRNNFAL